MVLRWVVVVVKVVESGKLISVAACGELGQCGTGGLAFAPLGLEAVHGEVTTQSRV